METWRITCMGAPMRKKLKKSEKLDLILSELAKLRGEVKKLARDRTAVAEQGVNTKPKSSPRRPKKLPKRTGPEKKPEGDAAPSSPILVQAPQVPKSTSRISS
jgi:hypothetical protein